MRGARLLAGAMAALLAGAATAGAQPPGCASPESGQFDFWLGEWEVSFPGGKATNRISKILDGCVVMEEYSGSGGLTGRSWSTYDPQAKAWRHTWVDNAARHMEFTGAFRDGRMEVVRAVDTPAFRGLQRLVWSEIRADALAWSMERSADGGKTWRPLWSARYERKR